MHKSDVGGLVLDLANSDTVASAVDRIVEQFLTSRPDPVIKGFSIHALPRKPAAFALIRSVEVGIIFRLRVVFAEGGTAVDAIDDGSMVSPPLNLKLAGHLVRWTHVYRRYGSGILGFAGSNLKS